MAEFLVEVYVPRTAGAAVVITEVRARSGARELTGEGRPVRFVRSMFVPEDETCFFLYEAASADLVDAAMRRAGLPFERVAELFDRSRGGGKL